MQRKSENSSRDFCDAKFAPKPIVCLELSGGLSEKSMVLKKKKHQRFLYIGEQQELHCKSMKESSMELNEL